MGRALLPLACSCRKKAKNFYVAGRRLTRLYLAGYGRFVSAILGSVIFSARIPLPLVCSCRKKAKNFYVAGRRLARLYFAGYGGFVSAVFGSAGAFGSGSPTVGLLLPEKGKELLRRGTALSAPLLCGIRRICVRGFWQCRGFWLGLSYRWSALARKRQRTFTSRDGA